MTAAILIVEDEKIIAKGIEKRLKGLGYTVAGMASTGDEAIERANTLRPDMILMDINLGGGVDGIEAASRIRLQFDIPVVFLTAFSDDATIQRAKLTEPFGFILKPYEDKDLQTAVEIGLYKHKMERRVRENEQWLAATLSSIGDGVIATDEHGCVRFMNTLAERLTGWRLADAVNRDVRDIFQIVDEKTRQPVDNPTIGAIQNGVPTELAPGTLLLDRGGSERPIDDSAAPIRGLNGKVTGAVLVFRDITERRRLEEHLRQAQKMEAIGRLAGGIAHDFNNIITIITGFCEFLLADRNTVTERQQFVGYIHDAANRAAGLTQQIMAFSRKQLLVPSVLNLNTIIRDMGAMVRRLIGENIEFVTVLAPDLGSVKADPTQIGQVFLNLATNARDAMPTGGRLLVVTSTVDLGEPITRDHPDVEPGRYALLSITDTGKGMPEEVLEHLFEPFFTTKRIGHGTGLGLATVYGIVKQSRGHLEVTSRIGEGSVFRIYLPVVDEPTTPSHAELPSGVRGNETILLVEDEEMVRQMTKIMLQQTGYTVLEAANGLEALAVAEEYPDPIHLLMTDLMMPNLSGREVADRLGASGRVERVLFMSGYTEDVIVHQDVASADAEFLHKPFSLNALAAKVREVLDRR